MVHGPSTERRRLIEQLGPHGLAFLPRPLCDEDDARRLERLRGRCGGQQEPEVSIDVEWDDDVVHAGLSDEGTNPLRPY